jgi:phosphopantetheinyl transferase (holo-ACP synthase)
VGNDVVDLSDPGNVGKSRDRRFCRRVFNDDELALIAASLQPDTTLWAIWAAKEAAYKAVSRGDPSVCSIPKKYPVILETSTHQRISTSLNGVVKTPHGEVFVRIHIKNAFLHALAAGTLEELTRIVARVEAVSEHTDDLPGFARKILLEEIAGRLACPVDELAILKEGVRPWAPYVTRLGARLPVTISLSHDGRYAAFALDPL